MLEEVVGLGRIVSLLLPWVVVVALLVDLQVDSHVAVVGVTTAVKKCTNKNAQNKRHEYQNYKQR